MNEVFEIRKVYSKSTEEDLKVLKFIHDHFKTHEMFERCLFTFQYVSDLYEIQKLCGKVVGGFPFMLQYCSNKYETRDMCEKVISRCPSMLKCCPDSCKICKMFKKVLDEEPYLLKYCRDRYKIREMCEKAFHCSFSSALSFASAFVTPKMLEDLDNAILDNTDPDKFTNWCNQHKQGKACIGGRYS